MNRLAAAGLEAEESARSAASGAAGAAEGEVARVARGDERLGAGAMMDGGTDADAKRAAAAEATAAAMHQHLLVEFALSLLQVCRVCFYQRLSGSCRPVWQLDARTCWWSLS